MTGVQKILAHAVGLPRVETAQEIALPENAVGISTDDPCCGVYGKLYIPKAAKKRGKQKIRVPRGVFIDLCGVLRRDAKSEEVAEFLFSICLPYLVTRDMPKIAPEFGGDSLTYLTAEDRLATAEKFVRSGCGFPPLFECDFVAAQYAAENGFSPIRAFFNDSPDDFEAIINADLEKV